MGLVQASDPCDSSGGLLWVRDEGGEGGGAVSNGISRICVPSLGWSVMFIRVNLSVDLHVSAWTTELDFIFLLIQSEPSFTPCYMCGRLTDNSQSKFVLSLLSGCGAVPYWIRGKADDYWRQANRVTCWRGFTDNTENWTHCGSFTASSYRHTSDWQLDTLRLKWLDHSYILSAHCFSSPADIQWATYSLCGKSCSWSFGITMCSCECQ